MISKSLIPQSLRWRLPLSYATIALVATISLGIILLTTLQRFYRQQELDYLSGNAEAISNQITTLVQDEAIGQLHAKIKGLAFLSQTRVKVFLPDRAELLADSGDPRLADGNTRISVAVEVDGIEQFYGQAVSSEKVTTTSSIVVESGLFSHDEDIRTEVVEVEKTITVTEPISSLPVIGTQYGFGLNGKVDVNDERSQLIVYYPIANRFNDVIGYVELSEGPAYGRQILRSVFWGWVIASSVAVVLAASVGWLASRRLTQPLLALTAATSHMAAGDLSVRVNAQRQDELGTLGHSFDKMADQVEGTVSTLRRFVADAAHELHTPLTALQTNLELVDATSEHMIRINRAKEQVGRLKTLTNNLLNLSRIEAQQPHQAWNEINLNELIHLTSELYASQAEQSGLVFKLALPTHPVIISGNEAQLRQALSNLLDNSLKFTPTPGEVAVTLEQAEEIVTITVTDTGIGIPADDLPQLFGRFHRGRNTADFPGSGLGLAIVKAIVAGHNGRITVTSQPNHTQFTLHLPG
jgi:signal transduction histidine kinase